MKQILQIFVSDPWEFGTENGTGPFYCEVFDSVAGVGSLDAELKEALLLKGHRYRFVKIRPRFVNRALDEVWTGKVVAANFVFTRSIVEAANVPLEEQILAIGDIRASGEKS